MDVQEGYGALADVAQVELVEREAADTGEGCEDVAAHVGHCVGVHAAVGEAAAVDALTIDLIVLCQVVDDGLEEVGILVVFTCGAPAREGASKDGEVDLVALGIGYEELLVVGNDVERGLLVVHAAACAVHGDDEGCIGRAAGWYVEAVGT